MNPALRGRSASLLRTSEAAARVSLAASVLRRSAATALLAVLSLSAPRADALAEELLLDGASGLHYLEIDTGGAADGESLPLVVAIHGLGDHPGTFRLLLDELPAKARLIIPRGPMPHGTDGFSWFAFHADDEEGRAELGEGIRSASDRVAKLIEALAKKHGGSARAVVCGFSQGGMLSFALAAGHPELVSTAIPVSGNLPVALWPSERPKSRPLPKIIAMHGESDKLVPVTTAKWSVEALRSNGYDSSLKSWPGVAHALSGDMRAALLGAVKSAVEDLSQGMIAKEGEAPGGGEQAKLPAIGEPSMESASEGPALIEQGPVLPLPDAR